MSSFVFFTLTCVSKALPCLHLSPSLPFLVLSPCFFSPVVLHSPLLLFTRALFLPMMFLCLVLCLCSHGPHHPDPSDRLDQKKSPIQWSLGCFLFRFVPLFPSLAFFNVIVFPLSLVVFVSHLLLTCLRLRCFTRCLCLFLSGGDVKRDIVL